jgi:glyoxylase-like metal-dependent hydrolase (beta-lactamase superfamily II)
MSNPLRFDVFASAEIPVVTSDLPPGLAERRWSPISSTLVSGERDAVLVDTFITVEQNRTLIEWIAASGKHLTTIYATHGHGDHFFGANAIRERFPNARFVAARDVIAIMRQQASSPVLESFWKSRFPGQIDSTLEIAEELAGTIDLEGKELVSVPLGHTDTDHTTCLHVPSIGLVVAGDAVYNDVHVYLAESNFDLRKEWLAALDMIESLKPRAVVAGHKRPGAPDTPNTVAETKQYILDFDRLAAGAQSAQELYSRMLALYPNRVNPGALWSSARGVKH